MSAAPTDQRAPAWMQALLQSAAEQLCMQGGLQCEFLPHDGPDAQTTYVASLRFDPVNTLLAIHVHHKASGRFVCRSVPACVDEIDAGNWCTDFAC